jgi:hypothetical protein
MRKNTLSKATVVAAFLFTGAAVTAFGATTPEPTGRTFNWETQCEKGNCYSIMPKRVFSEDGRVYVQFNTRRTDKHGLPVLAGVTRSGHAEIINSNFKDGAYVVPSVPHRLLLISGERVLKITLGQVRHYHYFKVAGQPLMIEHGRRFADWIRENREGQSITYVIKPGAFYYDKNRHNFSLVGVLQTSIANVGRKKPSKKVEPFNAQIPLPQKAGYAQVGAVACKAIFDQESGAVRYFGSAEKCRIAQVSPADE